MDTYLKNTSKFIFWNLKLHVQFIMYFESSQWPVFENCTKLWRLQQSKQVQKCEISNSINKKLVQQSGLEDTPLKEMKLLVLDILKDI